MKDIRIASLFVALVVLISIGCNKDDDPKTTKVFGSISIENTDTWAEWVDSGEVQVTVFPAFSLNPPAGWGTIPDGVFGPGIPGGLFPIGAPYNSQNPVVLTYEPGKTSYEYSIELDPGTYSAVAVGLKHFFITDSNRSTATLGVHWGSPSMVSHGIVIKADVGNGTIIPIFHYPGPAEFTVTEGEERRIDFSADFDFVLEWYR